MFEEKVLLKTVLATAISLAAVGTASAQSQPSNGINNDLLNVQNRCIVRLNDSISKFDVEGRARGMLASASA